MRQSGLLGEDRPRGFTLLEALIASVIMVMTVTAVTMAINGGRQRSVEYADQMRGSLAAESLLAEILASGYDGLPAYNGHDELPGTMKKFDDGDFPESFYRIGRRAAVIDKLETIPDFEFNIEGREIAVEAYDDTERVLVTLSIFVPKPVSP